MCWCTYRRAAAGAKGWHPDCRRTYRHPRIQSYRQTDIHTWLHTYILTDILTCKQSVPRQASNQALGLWKLLAMLWKLQQNRHFARMRQASRQASKAMEIAIDPMESALGIARMTLTVKLDGNWSSLQLASSAPPLSVTDSALAPSARMFFQQLLT